MASDDPLAKFNGVRPFNLLNDGEEREIKSGVSGTGRAYMLKRVGNLLSCSCPQWLSLKKVPELRSCKHLRVFGGDAYEDARLFSMAARLYPMQPIAERAAAGKRKRVAADDTNELALDAQAPEKRNKSNESENLPQNLVKDETQPVNRDDEPSGDPLREISGIRPDVWLEPGEERKVQSESDTKYSYRVKRMPDHYYCKCTAWRMQKDTPVNARSCKHLRKLLGNDYERARVATMAGKGSISPPRSDSAASPGVGIAARRKRSPSTPKPTNFVCEGSSHVNGAIETFMVEPPREINGIRPHIWLNDGEERKVHSESPAHLMYRVTRVSDHFHCTCVGWRMKKDTPLNARSCAHTRALLGAAYEDARVAMMGGLLPPAVSNGSSVSNQRVDTSIGKHASGNHDKTTSPANMRSDDLGSGSEHAGAVVDNVKEPPREINGIKPLIWLEDGEEREMESTKSQNIIFLAKRIADHFHCSCITWRRIPALPDNARTCPHLRKMLGDAYEDARVAMFTDEQPSTVSKIKDATPTGAEKQIESIDITPAVTQKQTSETHDIGYDSPLESLTESEDESDPAEESESVEESEGESESTDGYTDLADKPRRYNNPLRIINGKRPEVWLTAGVEQKVLSGEDSKYSFGVKRKRDHYICKCAGWRMQKSTPVQARTCKHLRKLLGNAYENARVAMMSRRVPTVASRRLSTAATKSRQVPAVASRKLSTAPTKSRASVGRSRSLHPRKPRGYTAEEADDIVVESFYEETHEPSEPSDNPIREINGISPKVWLRPGEGRKIKVKTSKERFYYYYMKRHADHYICTCIGYRNRAHEPVNARTCKHLRTLLGDAYEDARIAKAHQTNSDSSAPAVSSERGPEKPKRNDNSENGDDDCQPSSHRATPTASAERRSGLPNGTNKSETDYRDKANEDDCRPRSNKVAPAASTKEEGTLSKITSPRTDPRDKTEDVNKPVSTANESFEDPLREIKGIRPQVWLNSGEERKVQSESSGKGQYRVKRTQDHYYCTCTSWRMQKNAPVNARTCKHLKKLLGESYEHARLSMMAGRASDDVAVASTSTEPDFSVFEPVKRRQGRVAKTKPAPKLLLAHKWESNVDPTDWWASEKLDGVRTYWDGGRFYSRTGNLYDAPLAMLKLLPADVTLDGELWTRRNNFDDLSSIVRTERSERWEEVTFQVFDVPSKGREPFEQRLDYLKELFGKKGSHKSKFVHVVEHTRLESEEHMTEMLKNVEVKGGEGLMLRKPLSLYEGTRSRTLLKVKTFFDAEAEVIGYEAGKGRNKGVTGALRCKMASGKLFSVGSGLSDVARKSPPKVGAIVNYRFQQLTRDGVPRFPTYVGEAIDKLEPKDADIPEINETLEKEGETEDEDDGDTRHASASVARKPSLSAKKRVHDGDEKIIEDEDEDDAETSMSKADEQNEMVDIDGADDVVSMDVSMGVSEEEE